MVRPEDVLAQLDAANVDFKFPDLNHGYFFAIDCRLHAFSDTVRWALVVETVGYNPRGSNVFDVLHYFGNCLTSGDPGFEDDDFLERIDNMGEITAREDSAAFAGGTAIRVRGQDLAVDVPAGAALVEAFRALVPAHRDLLLATEAEVRRRIPADLPRVLQLQEWHQPDLFAVAPSSAQVYVQLADVLASADAGRYRPSEKPNTHWSNWLMSGSL